MSVFVGRREELAELDEITGAAAAGHVAAAVVVGEPGSGKSRLLAEAAGRAPLSNRFRVVGYEPEHEVPLAAASDLLLALVGTAPTAHGLEALLFGDNREEAAVLQPLRIFESAHRALRMVGPALCSSTTCSGSTSSRSRFAITSYAPPRTGESRSP